MSDERSGKMNNQVNDKKAQLSNTPLILPCCWCILDVSTNVGIASEIRIYISYIENIYNFALKK